MAFKDKIKAKEYQKRYYAENKIKYAEYYEAHKEKYAEYRRVYNLLNRGELAEKSREYYNLNADMVNIRKKNWNEENPEKVAAHNALNRAVKAGEVTKLPCNICGEVNVQGHHEDYSRPLEVIWLCCSCHKRLHTEMNNKD